jgi:hypothetical protein
MKSFAMRFAVGALVVVLFWLETARVGSEEVRIDKPAKATLFFQNGVQFRGTLQSLDSTGVVFRRADLHFPITYKPEQIKAVQTESKIYLWDRQGQVFRTAKQLGLVDADVVLTDGRRFHGLVSPPDGARDLRVGLSIPVGMPDTIPADKIQSIKAGEETYTYNPVEARLSLAERRRPENLGEAGVADRSPDPKAAEGNPDAVDTWLLWGILSVPVILILLIGFCAFIALEPIRLTPILV